MLEKREFLLNEELRLKNPKQELYRTQHTHKINPRPDLNKFLFLCFVLVRVFNGPHFR